MDENHLRRIRIRRGTNSQRKQILLEEGEFVYVNDIKRLYVGDNEKFGGFRVSNINHVTNSANIPKNSDIGDILYNKSDKSTYIIDKDGKLKKIIYSTDSSYEDLNRLRELELLLLKLQKICCNTEFALITDDEEVMLVDYGDFIKVKDVDINSIEFFDCKHPIISKKYLNLKSNKTYTLNIKDKNSSSDIVFLNGDIDRDTNNPVKPIKIVQDSINSSNNIEILSVTDTTITFKTNVMKLGISIQLGSFIDYDLENECGTRQLEDPTISGIVYDSTIDINTVNINEYITHISNKKYTMYKLIDPVTKDYPWDIGSWFALYFNGLILSDNYYVTEVERAPRIINGNWVVDKRTFGPIGPINGEGVYIFWHPKNFDLNVWNKGFGSNRWNCFPLFNTFKHQNDPEYYFSNKNIKPTSEQIKACLIKNNINPVQDYTEVYKGTQIPDFISII